MSTNLPQNPPLSLLYQTLDPIKPGIEEFEVVISDPNKPHLVGKYKAEKAKKTSFDSKANEVVQNILKKMLEAPNRPKKTHLDATHPLFTKCNDLLSLGAILLFAVSNRTTKKAADSGLNFDLVAYAALHRLLYFQQHKQKIDPSYEQIQIDCFLKQLIPTSLKIYKKMSSSFQEASATQLFSRLLFYRVTTCYQQISELAQQIIKEALTKEGLETIRDDEPLKDALDPKPPQSSLSFSSSNQINSARTTSLSSHAISLQPESLLNLNGAFSAPNTSSSSSTPLLSSNSPFNKQNEAFDGHQNQGTLQPQLLNQVSPSDQLYPNEPPPESTAFSSSSSISRNYLTEDEEEASLVLANLATFSGATQIRSRGFLSQKRASPQDEVDEKTSEHKKGKKELNPETDGSSKASLLEQTRALLPEYQIKKADGSLHSVQIFELDADHRLSLPIFNNARWFERKCYNEWEKRADISVFEPDATIQEEIGQQGIPNQLAAVVINSQMGKGVFLKPDAMEIEKDTFLGFYTGDMVWVGDQRTKQTTNSYLYGLEGSFPKEKAEEGYPGIDAQTKGNYTRLLNHASGKNANVYSKLVKLQSNQFVIAYFAKEKILPGEQLLIDYGPFYKFDFSPSLLTPKTFRLALK